MRLAALASVVLILALAGCGGGGGGGGGAAAGASLNETVTEFFAGGAIKAQGEVIIDVNGRDTLADGRKANKTGRWTFFFDPALTGGRANLKESEKVFDNGVHNLDANDYTLFNNDAGTTHATGSIRETFADRKGI